MSGLSQDKALIFRITHIDNVPWILANGMHSRNARRQDPNFRTIGNVELIGKRHTRQVPIKPNGTCSDYIPFYFTHHSVMLYNIKTGYSVPQLPMREIAIFVSNLKRIEALGISFVFTDRHAYLALARFFNDLSDLRHIDWDTLNSRNFRRDNPERFDRYQAEALIHSRVPIDAFSGLVCYSEKQQERIQSVVDSAGIELKVSAKPGWFF
jgi:ssDNA thymidine ADP-ribosyltransferase, DarT